MGPIPFFSVIDYCARYGVSEEDSDDVVYVIRQLDNWLTEYYRKKADKKDKLNSSNTRGKINRG